MGPDGIKGFQGVSPLPPGPGVPTTIGIGDINEPVPYQVGEGPNAAWRVGQFSFQALESTGTNYLFLQIGMHGMRHVGDPNMTQGHACLTSDECIEGTEVIFGAGDGKYNAHNYDHRQTSRGGETFDVQVNAIPAPGDFNGNGSVGTEDYAVWRSTFGQSVAIVGAGADGNGNGLIDGADYVMWRKVFHASVVNPPGDYDGNGSVGVEDYAAWRTTFGQSIAIAGTGADGNGNSIVDAPDYVVWRKIDDSPSGYGTRRSPIGSSISEHIIVPELTTLEILIVTTIGLRLQRHRLRKCAENLLP
jgi:hypothetical protein